jgi:HSP20 family protein
MNRNLIPWRTNLLPWRNRKRGEAVRTDETMSPFLSLHREMNRVFDDVLRDFDARARVGPRWPTIEICETVAEIKVFAEVPGLDKRDVEVTLHEGLLTLRGQKKLERNGVVYSERWEGVFERNIPVGENVDPERINASFKSGVLTVVLLKKPEARHAAKRIAIN